MALSLWIWPCFMVHWQDKTVHMDMAIQVFQSLKENPSYYILLEFISSGHKYLERTPPFYKGVIAGNGKHEHMWSCNGIPSKMCPLKDLSDRWLIIQLTLNSGKSNNNKSKKLKYHSML